MAGEGPAGAGGQPRAGGGRVCYYDALTRPPSARSIRHAWLLNQIREIHQASKGTYGARRVHAELTLGRGITVGHTAIEMLMARNDFAE